MEPRVFSVTLMTGDTLKSLLGQVGDVRGITPQTGYCGPGFRGRKHVGKTSIAIPGTPQPGATGHAKRKAWKNFGRCSAIEPIIGHLKSDFCLARNYLKGTIGDAINLLLAAVAFNFRKWMRALAASQFFVLVFLWADTRWGYEPHSKQAEFDF